MRIVHHTYFRHLNPSMRDVSALRTKIDRSAYRVCRICARPGDKSRTDGLAMIFVLFLFYDFFSVFVFAFSFVPSEPTVASSRFSIYRRIDVTNTVRMSGRPTSCFGVSVQDTRRCFFRPYYYYYYYYNFYFFFPLSFSGRPTAGGYDFKSFRKSGKNFNASLRKIYWTKVIT